MRAPNKIRLRLRSLFRRNRLEHELEAEFGFHLDQQIEENLVSGMPPYEARMAALRTVGGITQFLKLSNASNSAQRSHASFVRRHSGDKILFNLLIEMKTKFSLKLVFQPIAAEKRSETQTDFVGRSHLNLLDNEIDRGGEPVPGCQCLFHLFAAGAGERVDLCHAAGFG